MNSVLIMLGSNLYPEKNLELAKRKLALLFQIETSSQLLVTEPVGVHYRSPFTNIAFRVVSSFSQSETRLLLKQIEVEMGRTDASKQTGLIPIDIDLIFWNQELVHRDYERFPFVRNCIDQIR